MSSGREVSLNDVLAEMARIARSAPIACVVYLALVFASGAVPDLLAPEQTAWFLLGSVASLVAGYVVVRLLLQNAGLMAGGTNGFGSYFVLGILMSLGIGLGFLLLVLPGIYLMIRWLPAYGVLMAEEGGVGDSLGRSWDMTRGSIAPLLLLTLILFALIVLGVAIYAAPELGTDVPATAAILIGNFLIALYTVGLTLAGLATYGVLREQEPELGAVFA